MEAQGLKLGMVGSQTGMGSDKEEKESRGEFVEEGREVEVEGVFGSGNKEVLFKG